MMKYSLTNFRGSALALACAFFLASCASTKMDQKVYASFEKGDYAKCAKIIEGSSKNLKINDAIDVSLFKSYSGDHAGSAQYFEMTKRALDDSYTKSLTRGAASAIINENAREYSGNVYEYLLVNSFNCLNYINMGDLDEALVEVRQGEVKQKEYKNKYGSLDISYDENLGEGQGAARQLGINMNEYWDEVPRKPTAADLYVDSSFSHYLASILYTMDGSGDPELHAREYYALNPNGARLRESIQIPEGKGRLDVIALAGKIKERREGQLVIPFYITDIPLLNPTLKYVFPTVQGIPDGNYSARLVLDNGMTQDLLLVESFDQAVNRDVTIRARRDFSRSFVRSTVKEVTTVASCIAMYNNAPNELGRLASLAAIGPMLNAVNLTETADIRQAKYFPAVAVGGGFTLDPGVYSGTVEFYKDGNLIGKESFSDVRVRKNRISLIEKACIK